jgi:hypothetical protein
LQVDGVHGAHHIAAALKNLCQGTNIDHFCLAGC